MNRVWPWTASDVTDPAATPSPHREVESVSQFKGHVKTVHSLLTLGARTLPRHWRPSILGRSNAMDYLLDLLGEERHSGHPPLNGGSTDETAGQCGPRILYI